MKKNPPKQWWGPLRGEGRESHLGGGVSPAWGAPGQAFQSGGGEQGEACPATRRTMLIKAMGVSRRSGHFVFLVRESSMELARPMVEGRRIGLTCSLFTQPCKSIHPLADRWLPPFHDCSHRVMNRRPRSVQPTIRKIEVARPGRGRHLSPFHAHADFHAPRRAQFAPPHGGWQCGLTANLCQYSPNTTTRCGTGRIG